MIKFYLIHLIAQCFFTNHVVSFERDRDHAVWVCSDAREGRGKDETIQILLGKKCNEMNIQNSDKWA